MLAEVRDFAKTELELVERARFGQVHPPVEGHELFEASVIPLIKVVTQMKFKKMLLYSKKIYFTHFTIW